MPLLLDAYNILHVVGVLPPSLAGIDLDELADLVSGSRFRHEPTILVCDGTPRRHGVCHQSVHVRFAGPGKTADDLIARLVQRSTAPRRVTVITSDREIAQAVRRRRATVIDSERFLAMLAEDHATNRPAAPNRGHASPRHLVDQRQVEAWLRLFDLDPELHEIPSTSPSTPLRSPARRPGHATSDPGTDPRAVRQTGASTGPPSGHPNGSTGGPRPPAAPRSSAGSSTSSDTPRRRRSAAEAERLSDIDPATVDELDTAALLDASERPAAEHDAGH